MMSIDHFFLREFKNETQIRHYCYCARLNVFHFKSFFFSILNHVNVFKRDLVLFVRQVKEQTKLCDYTEERCVSLLICWYSVVSRTREG